ncbi:unnamed protein product [Trichobilharzia regenti]|nr:unnamed protein product [Trichobilharzia regenti]
MKGGIVSGSTIKKLNPFVIDDIIRVGGRLQLSCIPYDSKHAIILPSQYFITDMIVMHCHLQNAHASIMHVLYSLWEELWILKGYSTVRFAARRGYSERIFSDNGSNFKEADASLKEIIRSWDKIKIANNLLEGESEWHFNPPRASHCGGVWERVI